MAIDLKDAAEGPGLELDRTFTAINTSMVRITGTVSYGGSPVCAMVLANGQYMFTCSGDGSYSLDVPIDPADGSVTLYSFCSGLPPYKYVYTGNGNPPSPQTYTLSGDIAVPPGVIIDSDLNDVNEGYIANDSIGSAQSLPNPISVGGYVNVAYQGAYGRSYAIGDQDDYFQVECNAGDTIWLAIGNPVAGDLDLYLNNTGGTLIDSSMGTGIYEVVTAPAKGTYIVNVYAYSGASNYILAIGVASGEGAAAEADILSSRYEFVPGEVIVRFKETIQTMGSGQTPTERATGMGMTLASGAVDREMLMTFDDTDAQASVYQTLGVTKALSWEKTNNDLELERKLNTIKVIKALRKRGDILSAEPNYILHHCAIEPNDTHYGLQWHYPQINLPQAWNYTTGSDDVIVAVIDTGVLRGHPDLSGRLTSTGYDFIQSTSISNDGTGIDANPDDPGDATTGSSSFHGTHCAGTIGAATNNNNGLAGVTWSTKIMPVRVLGVGGGTSYDIMQGIRYAAGLSNDSGTTPAQSADILSMSLGGSGYSASTQALINEVRVAGKIIIAAAGNDNTSNLFYPASYDSVVSVSAVNINGTKASYSNYGTAIDIAAPGGDSGDVDGDGYADRVWSTCGDDTSGSIVFNYVAYNGTSMAAPHVAGVVALMKALYPSLTPSELDTMISTGAISNDIGDAGRDNYYGYGLIDALKAVVAAQDAAGGGVTTALRVDPTTVNFGTSSTSTTVTVSKIGVETISVNSYIDNGDWLTVSATSVDGNGLGSYTLTANRTGLTDGTHRATVTFNSSLGSSMAIQVSLQVSTTTVTYDAGYHYVLLVVADTWTIVDQYNVDASGGKYAYSFTNVPQGTYLIVAGSDRDNDNYINNPGESIGAYRSLDTVTYIDVATNLSGLDFETDLKLSISGSSMATELDEALPRFMRRR